MRNKLRCVLAMLCTALFITSMLPITLFAEETSGTQEDSSSTELSYNDVLNNPFVHNLLTETDLAKIPYLLQAAINSGDVYDISQLEKLKNFPAISENAVYIVFILDDYTPVGATSYEVTAETGDVEIQGAQLSIPSGYALTDPSETQTVQIVINEDGSRSFSKTLLAFHVTPVLPDPLPTLQIRYVDDGTTIYTEKKTLTNYEKTTIEANTQLLERLGYEIGEPTNSSIDQLEILECIFGELQQETSYTVSLNDRIPLIPSDFLVWYDFFCVDIPFAISGNVLEIEVDKVRDVDSTVNIVFQTKDGKQVGETSIMKLDPLEDNLTVNKDNLPALPVGYKLAEPTESHVASWVNVEGLWVISPKTLTFTVVSNQIVPIEGVNTNTPQVVRQPTVLSDTVTLASNSTVKSLVPATADNTEPFALYIVLATLSAGVIVFKIKKLKTI